MAKLEPTPTDSYLRAQRPEVAQALARVRAAIARAIPRAEEGISYSIPAFKLGTSPVIFFAGWKAHYSIYPASTALVAKFARELTPYSISKGTIRFPLEEKVPTVLIGRLAKFLFSEALARAAAKQQKQSKKKKASAGRTQAPPAKKTLPQRSAATRPSKKASPRTSAPAKASRRKPPKARS